MFITQSLSYKHPPYTILSVVAQYSWLELIKLTLIDQVDGNLQKFKLKNYFPAKTPNQLLTIATSYCLGLL